MLRISVITILSLSLIPTVPNIGFGQRVLRTEFGLVDLLEDEQVRDFFRGVLPGFPLDEAELTRESDRLMPTIADTTADISLEETTQSALNRAMEHVRRQEWRRARVIMNDALAIDPNHANLLYWSAIVSLELEDYSMAAHYFHRTLEIRPDHLDAIVGYARTSLYRLRVEEAEELLERAYQLAPRYPPVMFSRLLTTFLSDGQVEDEEFWQQRMFSHIEPMAQWISSDQQRITRMLGSARFARFCQYIFGTDMTGRIPQLIDELESYRTAKQRDEWNKAAVHLEVLRDMGLTGVGIDMETAITTYERGRVREAMTDMKRLAEENPDFAVVWFNYGFMLLREELYNDAVQVLRHANRIRTDIPRYRFALALALANHGNGEEAWQMIFELANTHPQLVAGWLDHQAEYMQVIRRDGRYRALAIRVGIPPHSL